MTWEGGEREGREEEEGWCGKDLPHHHPHSLPKPAERSQSHYIGDSLENVSIGVLSYRDRHWQGKEGGSDLSSTELFMGKLRALPECSSPCP